MKECKCGYQAECNFCSHCGERVEPVKPDIFELVKNGANSALEDALKKYSYNLEAMQSRETVLMLATRNKFEYCINVLIKYGADLNTKNKSGQTALDITFKNNNRNTAVILLKHGALISSEMISSLLADIVEIKDKMRSVEANLSVLLTKPKGGN